VRRRGGGIGAAGHEMAHPFEIEQFRIARRLGEENVERRIG